MIQKVYPYEWEGVPKWSVKEFTNGSKGDPQMVPKGTPERTQRGYPNESKGDPPMYMEAVPKWTPQRDTQLDATVMGAIRARGLRKPPCPPLPRSLPPGKGGQGPRSRPPPVMQGVRGGVDPQFHHFRAVLPREMVTS